MKYKYISPYKCNFMIGIVNAPFIIIIYFVISFSPLGNYENNYYCDNIFDLFKSIGNLDAISVILLEINNSSFCLWDIFTFN